MVSEDLDLIYDGVIWSLLLKGSYDVAKKNIILCI